MCPGWLYFPLPSTGTAAQLCKESVPILFWLETSPHPFCSVLWLQFWLWRVSLYICLLKLCLILVCCETSDVNPCKEIKGGRSQCKAFKLPELCMWLFIYLLNNLLGMYLERWWSELLIYFKGGQAATFEHEHVVAGHRRSRDGRKLPDDCGGALSFVLQDSVAPPFWECWSPSSLWPALGRSAYLNNFANWS